MLKIVLVNIMTLLRIPLSFVFCIVLLSDSYQILICSILFAIIVTTDFLDGKLARRFNIQTRLGAVFDVVSDFFFIVAASYSLYFRGLFPGWMLGVIIIKFMEFLITSSIRKRKRQGTVVFQFDPLGRFVAVAFYILPVLMLILWYYCSTALYEQLLNLICLGITVLAISSSTIRIIFLTRQERST